MGLYQDQLTRAMTYLGEQKNSIFIGQAVAYPGTAMTTTLVDVPDHKKIEFPVAEEMQMGASIGLALTGFVPVTIYPRWNFLLLAANQLVNHLDKMSQMSRGDYRPKVIIRTSVGSERPIHPQCQHVGDLTDGFRSMLSAVDIIRLEDPSEIFTAYCYAYNRTDGRSTILVEVGDFYNEK